MLDCVWSPPAFHSTSCPMQAALSELVYTPHTHTQILTPNGKKNLGWAPRWTETLPTSNSFFELSSCRFLVVKDMINWCDCGKTWNTTDTNTTIYLCRIWNPAFNRLYPPHTPPHPHFFPDAYIKTALPSCVMLLNYSMIIDLFDPTLWLEADCARNSSSQIKIKHAGRFGFIFRVA